jgi:two-component system, cell cycle response regulator CpdR
MTAHSILLVEDESTLALTLEDVLSESGFDVCVAFDGSAALAELSDTANQFDLVVTDIRLPGADGWAIARRARETNPQVPILYISGHKAADHAVEGVPNSKLLAKPFAPEALISAVSEALAEIQLDGPGVMEAEDLVARLEPLERAVLQLLANGAANAEIAQECELSPEAVVAARGLLMKKLGASATADLVRIALRAALE